MKPVFSSAVGTVIIKFNWQSLKQQFQVNKTDYQATKQNFFPGHSNFRIVQNNVEIFFLDTSMQHT